LLAAVGVLLAAVALAADAPAPVDNARRTITPPAPGMFLPPGRSITQIKGDLYRAADGGWFAAFLVTPAGIVLVDPLNPSFAKWLKAELAQRFPGKPVKYVIYSHSHWDHAEGGAAFADTAQFIAQETMLQNMDGRYPMLPGDIVDRNDNGLLDVPEFEEPFYERSWYCGSFGNTGQARDRNKDGLVTPKEFFADIVRPDITYSQRMTLRFGGKTLQLVFPGRNHANDGTAVLFTDERVLFSADFPADALVIGTLRSMPSACGPFDGHPMREWIESFRTLEALDFDFAIGGHGNVNFTKQDFAEARGYFEYLKREVESAMARGLSLDQMRTTIMLEPYKDWRHFDDLRVPNIEAAYRNLKNYR
jgi:glyoxylase-like metal-dependent hydrolase (beta-lactamase superfamily II)